MDRAREEYEAMTQLFIHISYEYKYDLTVNQSNKTLTMKVTDSGHELTFSYIYGNFKIFTVDEWDSMGTINTSNLQYLPSDIAYRVAKWKKQISERA